MDADPLRLRALYDEQLRGRIPARIAPGLVVERDGPLIRITGYAQGGCIGYRHLAGISGAELDALIARQRDHFAARGEAVEWKLHGHDQPADLPARLIAAGFIPHDAETVVVAPVEHIAMAPHPPDGVTLREVNARRDLERMNALKLAVWGKPSPGFVDDIANELALDPDGMTVVYAEAAGELVCSARVVFEAGTDFATLWGGGTHPAWRRRGIYHALVAHRARLAMERGFHYLQVDASQDSRPILERLGFVAITTTTPYVWSPP